MINLFRLRKIVYKIVYKTRADGLAERTDWRRLQRKAYLLTFPTKPRKI